MLGLAFICRHLSLDQATIAARIEEEFQLEIWGVVEGGHDMDRLNNRVSLSSAGAFMLALYDSEKVRLMIKQWQQ